MTKNVLVFGSIAGLIVSGFLLGGTLYYRSNPEFSGSMIIGFGSMIIAFAFIFIGIKNYRDKYANGSISYGKGLSIGLLIAFIASSFYVITWLIEYNTIFPDFMEKYSATVMKQYESSGMNGNELALKAKEMETMKEMYKSPLLVILLTYMEVLPIGILVALIAPAILRKKKVVAA